MKSEFCVLEAEPHKLSEVEAVPTVALVLIAELVFGDGGLVA
jgi:hypothetical protein